MTASSGASTLRSSILDGFFYSLMVGLSESYLAAYVIHRGFSAISAGLIVSLPMIAGAALQMLSPRGISYFSSYKNWVLVTASIQGLSLGVLGFSALIPGLPVVVIFVLASVYWGAGMATGPAWNAWMSGLVKEADRTHFFSRRSLICHLAVMMGLFSGGMILELFDHWGQIERAYGLLFAFAGLCRGVSVYYLNSQPDRKVDPGLLTEMHWLKSLQFVRHSELRKLFTFMLCFQGSIFVAAGFFNPHMLRELRLSPQIYMVLLALSFLGRMLMMPLARYLAARFSLYSLLVVATIGISPIPFLWYASGSVYILAGLQIISGLSWGLYEIVTFLILFNGLPLQRKAGILTLYNVFQTLAIVGGSIVGSFLFYYAEAYGRGYQTVFLVSTGLRLVCILMVPEFKFPSSKIREWVFVRPFSMLSRPIIVKTKAFSESRKKPRASESG